MSNHHKKNVRVTQHTRLASFLLLPPPPPRFTAMAEAVPGMSPLASQWKEYVLPGGMFLVAVWWVFG